MNSMKFAFKKVRDYLGRDTHGIALLQKAETLSDELRKENSKLRQDLDSSKQNAETAIEKRLSCERQLQKEQELRMSLESRLKQSSVTIERLEREIRPLPPTDASEPINTEKAIHRQVKMMRHDGFNWPPRYLISEVEKLPGQRIPIECYDVSDIIKNWSGKELLKLGRFVALETIAMNGYMTMLYSSQKIIDKSESTTSSLLGLLQNCMTTSREDAKAAMLVGSKAEPPRLRAIERTEEAE